MERNSKSVKEERETYISIELANEAREVAVFKERREQVSGELRRLPNHEPHPVSVPRHDMIGSWIINQHVRLQEERRWRRLCDEIHQQLTTMTVAATYLRHHNFI